MLAPACGALGSANVIHPKFLVGLVCVWAQVASAAVSESDYLADVPTVISVSRIAQTLEDTPGAVTILDRPFIRMTGARDVVDLLRFVPGFQTTSAFETDAPMATYHGRDNDWANRIQVLVDGRSVYSSLLDGSAGIGWQTLALDDIERIEVLRGSNSATYGARAFLGVVNIISRDVRETQGPAATITQGDNGVSDQGLRIGWSQADASFRLSADSVSDNGLQGAFGKSHTERLNFSSHMALDQGADLDLRAGAVGIDAGRGSFLPNQYGNPARMRFMGSQFVQLDWHQALDDTHDLAISASHTENSNKDRFLYLAPGAYYLATVDFSGDEWIDALTLQNTIRLSSTLRTVWGAEVRREQVVSAPQFDGLGGISSNYYRLFGSAEWRLSDRWLLNAGALAESNDLSGNSLSPRLMLNWQLAPGHTFRIGASTAFRPPSAFEKFGRIQYLDANGQNPTGYYTFNNGSVGPEKLFSRELGYNLELPGLHLGGDVRVFNEQITNAIVTNPIGIIPGVQYQSTANAQDDQITGVEMQANWAPQPDTKVFLTQTWTQIHVSASPNEDLVFRAEHGAPRYAFALTLMHDFSSGLHLSLMQQASDEMALMSDSGSHMLYSMQRTDLRLAQDFRLGNKKAMLALVLQNLGTPYQDGDWKFRFERRAMLTLKIED